MSELGSTRAVGGESSDDLSRVDGAVVDRGESTSCGKGQSSE